MSNKLLIDETSLKVVHLFGPFRFDEQVVDCIEALTKTKSIDTENAFRRVCQMMRVFARQNDFVPDLDGISHNPG